MTMSRSGTNKEPQIMILVVIFVIGALTQLGTPVQAQTGFQKIDCNPEQRDASQQECERRQCEFQATPGPGEPACFYKQQQQGYNVTRMEDTVRGFRVHLQARASPPFGGSFKAPVMDVQKLSEDLLRISFEDGDNVDRYKVPVPLTLPENPLANSPKYDVIITGQSPFSFRVIRKDTNVSVWDTGVGGLVLSDQFLQLATALPSSNVYGLGENLHDSFKHRFNNTWPAFARDQPPSFSKGENLYGVHPFYTCVEDSQGNTHGVLLFNSNAQDFTLSALPMLTYRTIGGILDFYFFFGPSPEQVIQQYTAVIGRPMMPPYWALGFQLSRYGYNHLAEVKAAVDTTRQYGIPQDVQYVDIDYMDERRDFTLDQLNFGGLNQYFQELHHSGMRTIIMLDPCLVSNYSDYQAYETIKKIDGYIKWSNDVTPPADSVDTDGAILGYVWPRGKTAFPDFFKNGTREAWLNLIVELRDNISFDGLWIDMNEPASFGTNEERPFNWPESAKPYWSLKCPASKWDDPPYPTKAAYLHDSCCREGRLSDKTICLSTVQGDRGELRHYDVHSLFGYSQTSITRRAARTATGERSVVITRSTFPGSGRYAGHWLGDNQSKWADLRHSIIGALEFNLFGIPYVGADICGFFGDTTPELCKRWMQLGAFYTFSRNHNGIDQRRQDPGALGEEVAKASREILETRYWLLPYLYTLFHQVHTQGGTVIRPLHHEFSTDLETLEIDRQFLWGPALLISPILEEGQRVLTFYTPSGKWYDFFSGHVITGPRYVTVAVTSESKPVLLVRGGNVLPLQKPAANTALSRKNPFKLLVALDEQGSASGSLFWDDGVSIDAFQNGNYYLAEYNASTTSVEIRVTYNNVDETATLNYSDLEVWGVDQPVHDLEIRDAQGLVDWRYDWDYDPENHMIKIFHMAAPLAEDLTITWKRVEKSVLSRVDCWPERQGGVDLPDSAKCQQRGCVYQPHPDPAVPDCFFPQHNYGYSVDGPWQTTAKGKKVNLRRVGTGPFGYELDKIVFTMEEYGNDLIRFKFDSPQEDRYTVPVPLSLPRGPANSPQYRLEVVSNDTFAFRIVRRSTGTVIFDTSVGGLVFHDQFLQLSSRLASRNVFGMGENIHSTFRRDLWFHTYAFFGRDQPTKTDDTLTHYYNHYGTHPFLQCVEKDGNAHGVLFFNSDPQDYTFTPLPMVTYRTIGGILDFYLFMGSTPENVVKQYTAVIGLPYMPPYWALGFQLCKYGYNSLDNLKTAVERTREAGIPHDVQYADIDHMSERRDFTLDNSSFQGLAQYFQGLRDHGMRTIIILDPALVSNSTDYEPYSRLKAVGGFIKWPNDSGYTFPADSADTDRSILGYVWPRGKTVFPDFFKSKTREVWKELITEHRNRIAFDGLWIDMNEPAVFGTNEERPFNWPADVKPYWSLKCPFSKLDDPPYRTGAAFNYDTASRRGRLSDKTLCLSTVQGERDQYRHYDLHNLYGWSQTAPTLQALRSATGQRGVVVSRSTFVGSGQSAGHWLGDNLSSWGDLRASIPGILEFNLFGFTYTGADICGHFGTASAELCKRWMQLGAFYTFSRNHNAVGNRDQDPGNFDEEVSRVSRQAMRTRYLLLPYLYTLFHVTSIYGGTVLRPLHHEFPTDPMALGNSRQFLWGSNLLISPVLYPNVTSLTYYLPKGTWYDFYTGALTTSSGGLERTVSVLSDSPTELQVRGGAILPLQAVGQARNTTFTRKNPFELLVALNATDGAEKARGQLFWDDGVSIDTFQTGKYLLVNYTASMSNISALVIQEDLAEATSLRYGNITVLGMTSQPDIVWVTLGTKGGPSWLHARRLEFVYDSQLAKLVIMDNQLTLSSSFVIQWESTFVGGASRVDCWPELFGRDSKSCQQRHCEWGPLGDGTSPDCFFPTSNFGYKVVDKMYPTSLGQSGRLKVISPGPFGHDWDNAIFSFEEHGDNVLRFKFSTEDGSRYEVPKHMNLTKQRATNAQYRLEVTSLEPFAFRILRNSTGAVLLDTGVGGLVLEDQFLQLSTRLCSSNVYGIGENFHLTFRHDTEQRHMHAIFNKDIPATEMADAPMVEPFNFNLHGTHPFYQCVERDGSAHGVLLLNSNAQDFTQTSDMMTIRTIGGVLDFYVFLGPSPEQVSQQYTSAIGRPFMPPYWALGHQLRTDVNSTMEDFKNAVDITREAGIPLDVQYAGVDTMDQKRDFTIDNVTFAGLTEYFHQLRQGGMHTIIVLNAALEGNSTDYEPYSRLKAVGGFIKWPNDTGYTFPADAADTDRSILGSVDGNFYYFTGEVWPSVKSVFPDFFKASVQKEWRKLIVEHRDRIDFDGIKIEMNEPYVPGTNFGKPRNWPADKPYWPLNCPVSRYDDPPYRSAAAYWFDNGYSYQGRLSDDTLCLSTVQGERDQYRHYDLHNLYGWSQTAPTLQGLREAVGERGVVISRSTFVGSGQHAGHMLGDYDSSFTTLRDSIIAMLEFNLFGITYTGADIWWPEADYSNSAKVFNRWIQLGAFYTLSRSRYVPDYKFDNVSMRLSREAMETRYWLLPYLYTLMHFSHTQGNTVLRPLHHEFSTDGKALRARHQFLWGAGLLISPIVHGDSHDLKYYLPKARWYNFYTGALASAEGGVNVSMTVESDSPIQLHVRGGHILPMQEPARNTTYSRRNPMKLIVALNAEDTQGGAARGSLFWDDGTSIDTFENGNYFLAEFTAQNRTLSMRVAHNGNVTEVDSLNFALIEIWGVTSVPGRPLQVALNGNALQSGFSQVQTNDTQILRITQALPLKKDFIISWS